MEAFIKRLPLGIFCLFAAKSLIISASWNDVAIIAISASIAWGVEHALSSQKEEAIYAEIKALKEEIKGHDKKLDTVATGLTGIRLGQKLNVK